MRNIWHRLILTAAVLALLLAHLCSPAPINANPGPWTYVALGDSLAVGWTAFVGYVSRYRSGVQTDTGVTVNLTNRGQSGWTSAQLANALRNDAVLRGQVASATVLTWNIGGNDLKNARASYRERGCGGADNQDCLRAALSEFERNWSAIGAETSALRSSSNTILRTQDIYNPYVATDRRTDTTPGDAGNDLVVFKSYLDRANAAIAAGAATYGYRVAGVYARFNGPSGTEDPKAKGYISWDGLHPNDTGHRVISDLLRGLGYAPLR